MVTNQPLIKTKTKRTPQKQQSSKTKIKRTLQIPTVKDMISHLDERVHGNTHAKEALAIAFKNIEYRANFPECSLKKTNLMLFGETGTGKTYMLDLLTKYCKMPLIKINLTGRTPAGIWGQDIAEDFELLIDKSNPEFQTFMEEQEDLGHSDISLPLVQHAPYSVVYLDEIDKLGKQEDSLSSKGLQNEIIGLSEDRDILNNNLTTKHMLFVASGAFVGLDEIVQARLKKQAPMGFSQQTILRDSSNWYEHITTEDLIKYGLKPELLGRFPINTRTDPMTMQTLCAILDKKESPLKTYTSLLIKAHNLSLRTPPETKEVLASYALESKTNARGLESAVEKILRPYFLDTQTYEGEKIVITPKDAKERLYS
ncbi:MAG: AAA family ATPase [Candidatus Woesearchaeota archaeon]